MTPMRLVLVGIFSVMLSHAALAAKVPNSLKDNSSGHAGAETPAQEPQWPKAVKAPDNAPNIILILLDDVGFAASSTFGGPARTPVLEALAGKGLRYNNFHTTALCSPTRAALLSGRNSHRIGFGTVSELARGEPGYNSVWPKNAASIAAVLRENGYSTAAFGKWHNTPVWEISPVGPFDRWPTGLGFEHFYGFMAGETSQWEPTLYRNTTPVKRPLTEGYYFTTDMTDKSIAWLHMHQSLVPDKPYFLYYAPAATHAPHHVPKAWIKKYHGQFDKGWDVLRNEIFARQKALGVIPADTDLPERPHAVPAWGSLSPAQKKIAARQMEVYAAFLAEADHEVGRLLNTVDQMPHSDNTLIFYIVGDNGADASAGVDGSEYAVAQLMYGVSSTVNNPVKFNPADLGDLGGPLLDNCYAHGWAWALSTPFKGIKGDASHFGGTRDGMVVSWPSHIKDNGSLRTQFTHVTDIASTIYEAVGIKAPDIVNGVMQLPQDGTSFVRSFHNAQEPSHHHVQYFEIMGNRAVYEDGWVAAAPHWSVWDSRPPSNDFSADKWELYNVQVDFSEAHDLAARDPERLERLTQLFDKEARRNEVYPLGNAFSGGKILGQAQPSLTAGKSKFTYYPVGESLPIATAPDLTRSHNIVADLVIPAQGKVQGTILSIGSRFGGMSLYVKGGYLVYENNFFGMGHGIVTDTQPLPTGNVRVVFDLTRDGNQRGGGGWGRLFVNGRLVGENHFDHIGWPSALFGAFDIGATRVSPVTNVYEMPFDFTGTIKDIAIEIK